MTQATLEEPKPADTISDLSVLVASVPKLYLDVIGEARKAANGKYLGVACDGLGKVPDLPAIARGEPRHEVTGAAWEKIQRIETIIAASARIITGLAADSSRFDDIRVAIREAVHRVREYGRATINEVCSLNIVNLNINAVSSAAFKALEESAEQLGELSQVPLRARSPVVTSEVDQHRSALASSAAEKDILTATQATELYARLTNTRPDKRRAKRELRDKDGKYTTTSVLRRAKPIIDKKPLVRKGRYTCPQCGQRMSQWIGAKKLCPDCFAKEHDFLTDDAPD